MGVAEVPAGGAADEAAVPGDQLGERGLVAGRGEPGEQVGVGGRVGVAEPGRDAAESEPGHGVTSGPGGLPIMPGRAVGGARMWSGRRRRAGYSPRTSAIVYRPAGRPARNFAASSAPRA